MPQRFTMCSVSSFARLVVSVVVVAVGLQASCLAQVPGGEAPLLRIETSGPVSTVSAVAFSPNGEVLYATGWDKVVHVWRLENGSFVPDPSATYRVPIGGGLDGAISALAVSQDGQWLAVGGRSAKRGIAGQRESGTVFPGASMSADMWLDEGLIYVFNTQTRQVRTLRGHQGAVVTLKFAPQTKDQSPVLVSAASTRREADVSAELIVWDVLTSAPVRKTALFPMPAAGGGVDWKPLPAINPMYPPRFAVWRTGTGPSDVRVALIWGIADFGLRVWEASSGRMTLPTPGDKTWYLLTADWDRRFLTAGGNQQTGRVDLDAWTPPAGSIRGLVRGRDSTLLRSLDKGELAITAESLPASHQPVVVVGNEQTKQTKLIVLSPDGRNVAAEHPLWDGLFVSHIASSQSGRHVAVAHYGSNEMLVFKSQDLLGRQAVPQRIRPAGVSFERVAFVHKGDEVGVKLTGGDPAQSVVFNVTGGKASPADGEWTADEIGADWKVTSASTPTELTLNVTSPEGKTTTIAIPAVDAETVPELTAAAVCPVTEQTPMPLLIVAFHKRLEPELRVYNLDNGEWIRRFTGHTGPITGLAVSGNGRLAASTSVDRSVRIWRLDDLADVLGRNGLLRDGNTLLELINQDGRIIARNSVGKLTRDIQITSVDRSGETRPFHEAWDVYEYAHMRSPGDTLSLNVVDAGADRTIDVVLGQAIDDRKALFALHLIPPADEGADWQWIGWSPLGPFDSSGPDAERRLGWHFNTKDPQTLTRFAAVGEYRDDFYTPELLKHLYETGTLPQRQAFAPPRLMLMIAGADGQAIDPDVSDRVPVRDGHASAILKMSGEFPPRLIKEVSGLVTTHDGQQVVVPSHNTGDREWTFDLSQMPWSRGLHRLDVQMATSELTPRTFDEQLTIRFQPPPPGLSVKPIASPAPQEQATLTVEVAPAAGAPTRLVVEQAIIEEAAFGSRQVGERWEQTVEQQQTLTRDVTLQPGLNRLTVSAENVGATYGFEGLESARQTIDVLYTPMKEPVVPTITLNELMAGAQTFPITADEPIIEVDLDQVTLRGVIDCGDELKTVQLRTGETVLPIKLEVDAKQPFVFEQSVGLAPGENVVAVSAQSESAGQAQAHVRIRYVPRLPAIADVTVDPVARTEAPNIALGPDRFNPHEIRMFDLLHEPSVRVQAQVTPDEAGHPYDVTMLIDGEPASESTLAVENGRLDGTVTIPPGRHRLRLRFSNAWQRAVHPWENTVAYLQPPSIREVHAAADLDTPQLTGVALDVETPADLPLIADQTLVTVNGAVVPVKAQAVARDDGLWTVSLESIPLDMQGENVLTFAVANADGLTLQPVSHRVNIAAPPEPKPTLTMLGPGSTLQTASAELEFRVASDSPIRSVHVKQDGTVVGTDLTPASVDGLHSTYRFPITLQPGQNRFEVEVVNAGGAERHSQVVAYTPPPLLVHVDRLGPLTPSQVNERMQFSSALETSTATLTGYVEFPSAENPPQVAQFWVNGFMQRAVELEPVADKPNRRSFEVALFFNRHEQNRVEVNLPDVAVDQSSDQFRSFTVDCLEPKSIQELHLLVIGAAVLDTKGLDAAQQEVQMEAYRTELKERALDALQARTGSDDRLVAPSFARVHPIIVLTGRDAVYRKINSALASLSRRIRPSSPRDETVSNSVLMVYYHGKEVQLDKPGRGTFVLATTETWDAPASNMGDAITSDFLTGFLSRFYGAHLLFLDVQTPTFAEQAHWPTDPHLGIVRIASPVPAQDSYPLMVALEDVLPQTRFLKDVQQRIQERFSGQAFLSDISIPAFLGQLEIGGRAASSQ